jgi:hypothetical protein
MLRLYDSVILNEPLKISEEITALPGTPGTIVEILGNGEAYMVELFGNWTVCDEKGDLAKADADTPGAFRETVGVETVFSHQIQGTEKIEQTRLRLLKIMDALSEDHLEEISDFAEFLYHKQHQAGNIAYQQPTDKPS